MMVPRILTSEQKEIRMNVCADILQNIENDPKFRDRNNMWWIMVFSTRPRNKASNPTPEVHQFTKAKEIKADKFKI